MSSILKGNKINVSVFGQSHSKSIGAVIDGLPAGFEINFDEVSEFMKRRAGFIGTCKFHDLRCSDLCKNRQHQHPFAGL